MERNIVEIFRQRNISKTSSLVLYYAGREQCMPHHHFGPAIRAQYLLHFIVKGKGVFHSHGKQYNLTKNQLFIIKPGETTYYMADEEDPWEYIWFAFDGTEAETILQNCGLLGETPVLNYVLDNKLMSTLMDTIEQLNNKTENEYLLLGNLFHVFGYLTINYHNKETEVNNIHIKHALNYIRNNFSTNIQVQDIANYVQIERSYLYRLFMDECSMSPKQFLLQYRIKVATDLLTNTNQSISEIALSCGFNDASSFCKYFHRITGFTPLKYRNIDGNTTLSYVNGNEK